MSKPLQTICDVIPLKPGKLEAYKKFVAEFTGPRKKEYSEMLGRYGLRTVDVFYKKINDVEFVMVVHQADLDAREKLKNFTSANHPMEKWFLEQLTNLHYFEPLNGQPQASERLFSFVPLRKMGELL